MKKVLSLALCGLAVFSLGAQKTNVEQAKKLAGKVDKIGDARALIGQALSDPETANQADTYYVAGKIEWDAFNKNKSTQAINPEKVNPLEMGEQLLNGYNYFIQVFPLDQIPNEKGEIKPKYIKELQKKIAEKESDFFEAGANFYNTENYPQAYQAFMIYGDLPELDLLGSQAPLVADTIRAVAYFNAGLAAWTANNLDNAAEAFKKARLNNYTDPNACIYEIATWQNIQQRDENRLDEAKDRIYEAATAGFEQFGMEQPVFLNNIVNSLLNSDKEQEALNIVNGAIEQYPDLASLYGLRGFVYDRLGNDDASEADYRKASGMDGVDEETLKNGSKKLLRIGQTKWNDIPLGDPEALTKKADIKNNYFYAAKAMVEKARELNPSDPDLDYLTESVDYAVTLN